MTERDSSISALVALPAASLAVCALMLFGGCESENYKREREKYRSRDGRYERVTYYAPVLSPDGENVAYLKRDAVFTRVGPGGFWGRPDLGWSRDRLLLCRAKRDLQREECIEGWSLPLTKVAPAVVGLIVAQLAWEGDRIRYHIRLLGLGHPCATGTPVRDLGSGPECVISNQESVALPGPPSPEPATWRVRLDEDPMRNSILINNKIIVERIPVLP
jgi:hypothetical protein